MIHKILTAAALVAGLALPAAADPLAKDVFGAFRNASQGPAVSIGYYSQGCGQGFAQLPESGPSWQAMRLSRNRNWGHPELVSFLVGLSQAAQQAGWRGLYVGDMSQPRGGPMTSGHASHQMGLDADIWMLPPSSLSLSPGQRESLSSVSVVNGRGTALSGNWTPSHMSIIRAAARDRRVERIFVDPVVKVAMCQMERGNRSWLRKVRPLNNHTYHFHVRMSCPRGSICRQQPAPPPGDGCAEAAEWIKNRIDPSRVKPSPPDPNYRHPRTYRLSELPSQCSTVASAP
ncbi:penicillin-insensitive murein endopeptidase [Paracoccus fistulariae]|uniref:Penicillin-insensitive murein endopeptidase n=1 Tax=Paracoccus fistulariae TaxID=658446 RepID=A0ABY7SGF9_9RHOB|nr:penicillin-insensitive murein endopeptidase [Paracoccus fistulariae]MDB6182890.1 penicillin-insensitive murein endopeptidase [Paracoccus fistulariae]WCR06103.1 penicillin-insensitive murein endopeptidase [Paracoccus fistulariae]